MPRLPLPPEDWLAGRGLSEPVLALARRGQVCRYAKGTLLIQEGLPGDTLYIVLDGRLRAFGSDASSDREITYGSYGAGEYVGEMGLDGGPRAASVVTLEKTVCAVITRRTLEQHLADEPAFAFELLTKVIRRARAATLSAKRLALEDVYGRLRLLLESAAVAQPDGSFAVLPHQSHREMSQQLGCGREMVSRLMKDLVGGGYVMLREDRVVVLLRALPPRW